MKMRDVSLCALVLIGGSLLAGCGAAEEGSAPGATGDEQAGSVTEDVTLTALGKFVMTWYSFQDNTPVNSSISSSGRKLLPYISVAVPFTQLKGCAGEPVKNCTGKLSYGDKIYVEFLHDRVMPNGAKHTGWVEVDDYCGDSNDDAYCYQKVGGKKYPNVDLYIGDFVKSGMGPKNGDCTGPAGTGQELTNVSSGSPGSAFVTNYGGSALGTGKCGDKTTARKQQDGPKGPGTNACWGYDDQTTEGCLSCKVGVECASR